MSKVHNESKWAEARRLCRLSDDEIRAAREMGLNPLSLIKNIPSRSESWKAPVGAWIRDMYEKRYCRPVGGPRPGGVDAGLFAARRGAPDSAEIDETSFRMQRRHREFRRAAEWVARELANLPDVQKVVLFGSVAVPLEKEVPRFAQFRRARIAIWHECKDVDLAVWVSGVERLKELQLARSRAVNALFQATGIGVAHHQVDVFLIEHGTDRYLGRLCGYGVCPKGKRECETLGCGSAPFLQQHAGFEWRPSSLAAAVTLFDRARAGDDCPF